MSSKEIIDTIKKRKVQKVHKRNFKKAMLAVLLAVSPVPIVLSCTNNNTEETPQIETYEEYRPEGYFNRFPIQIYLEDDFDEVNKNLIIESLTELDNELDGVKFEYHTYNGVGTSCSVEKSCIYINLDEEGTRTITAYQDDMERGESYAFANRSQEYHFTMGDYNPYVFNATITMGSYFTITEDIPDSDKIMGLELRWNNYSKFGAYVDSGIFKDDNYWDFNTTYNEFKENVETALKGVVKHETSHALGYQGNTTENCPTDHYCHSSDEDSIMYEWFGDTIKSNTVTDDVIAYFRNKYPSDTYEPNK
ncbi:MAG: hypothetical protein AB7S44_03440 [Spirochaetales bacterium]